MPGCETSKGGAYCRVTCACEGCSDSARAQCEREVRAAETEVEDAGCADSYDALLRCIVEDARCDCGNLDVGPCDAELVKFSNCGVDAPIGENVCETLTRRWWVKQDECEMPHEHETCTGSIECTDYDAKQARCQLRCIPLLDCNCYKDTTLPGCVEKLAAFSDCVLECHP